MSTIRFPKAAQSTILKLNKKSLYCQTKTKKLGHDSPLLNLSNSLDVGPKIHG